MYQHKCRRVVFQVSKTCTNARKNTQSKQYYEDNTHKLYRKYGAYVSPIWFKSSASRHARRGVGR